MDALDPLDSLDEAPFSYRHLKSDALQLFYKDELVVTLRPRESLNLLGKLERANPAGQQRLLAKATGQFKFGNERAAETRRRNKRNG